MEEVKSAKVNKNLNTGHKRPSKFMIFDKQKSSDIKFYGNQNSKEYSKSKGINKNFRAVHVSRLNLKLMIFVLQISRKIMLNYLFVYFQILNVASFKK